MDILLYGLQVTVIGLVVVFVGLFLLIICIEVMGILIGKGTQPEPIKAVPVPVPVSQPGAEPAELAAADDSEVVAAIMAAISCMSASSGKQLVIRSIRKSSNSWKNAYR